MLPTMPLGMSPPTPLRTCPCATLNAAYNATWRVTTNPSKDLSMCNLEFFLQCVMPGDEGMVLLPQNRLQSHGHYNLALSVERQEEKKWMTTTCSKR